MGWACGVACGGWVLWGVLTGGFYVSNLVGNAMPGKEEYMRERYGGEWERYVGEVGWKLVPGVY